MVPGLTSSRARPAAACFWASTSAGAVAIYLIEPMSARIDGMGRLMDAVPGRVIRKFLEDQAPNWAALIAWNALLALFPIVLFAASLLGFALRMFGEANDAVYKTIFMVILFTILVGVAVATSAILPALKHIPHMPEFLYSDGAGIILQMIVGVVAG